MQHPSQDGTTEYCVFAKELIGLFNHPFLLRIEEMTEAFGGVHSQNLYDEVHRDGGLEFFDFFSRGLEVNVEELPEETQEISPTPVKFPEPMLVLA
jgi:hypothetical protein